MRRCRVPFRTLAWLSGAVVGEPARARCPPGEEFRIPPAARSSRFFVATLAVTRRTTPKLQARRPTQRFRKNRAAARPLQSLSKAQSSATSRHLNGTFASLGNPKCRDELEFEVAFIRQTRFVRAFRTLIQNTTEEMPFCVRNGVPIALVPLVAFHHYHVEPKRVSFLFTSFHSHLDFCVPF